MRVCIAEDRINGTRYFRPFRRICVDVPAPFGTTALPNISGHNRSDRTSEKRLSLGDKGSLTKNVRMKNTGVRTEEVTDILRVHGIGGTYGLDPGGHFRDMEFRIAQGLLQL